MSRSDPKNNSEEVFAELIQTRPGRAIHVSAGAPHNPESVVEALFRAYQLAGVAPLVMENAVTGEIVFFTRPLIEEPPVAPVVESGGQF